MDLWRGTSFIQSRAGWVFLPVVVCKRSPFAKTGRLFASGYSVLIKYLGVYGLMWVPSDEASQSRRRKWNNRYILSSFPHWFIAWFVKNHESYGHEHCHFCLAFWMCDIMKKVGVCGTSVLTSQTNLFRYSLVKNEPTWLHSEKLKFEVKKCFCCIHVENRPRWCLQMEILAHLCVRVCVHAYVSAYMRVHVCIYCY